MKNYLEAIAPRKQNVHMTHLEDEMTSREGMLYVAKVLREIAADAANDTFKITVKYDGCIHPDCILLTEIGDRTIKEIIDSKSIFKTKVLSHNFQTQQDEFVVVDNPIINNNNKNWVAVELENGEIIRTTEDHPFYTINRGWVKAKDLNEQDEIMQKK